jgi:hypothetical protein
MSRPVRKAKNAKKEAMEELRAARERTTGSSALEGFSVRAHCLAACIVDHFTAHFAPTN